MARAVVVVGDAPSADVAEMRRTINTLLLMLESAEASITAGATAEDVLNAWADAVRTGLDSNPAAIANIVSTGREVVGIQTTPAGIPRTPRMGVVTFDSTTPNI